MIKSVRVRLAFSFGAIALLVALSLGLVLLWILQDYYSRLERDYLTNNAVSIGLAASDLFDPTISNSARISQLQNYAFLLQTRIRLLDRNDQVIADTGPFQNNRVLTSVVRSAPVLSSFSQTAPSVSISADQNKMFFFVETSKVSDPAATNETIAVQGSTATIRKETSPSGDVTIVSSMPARATVYGFQLGDSSGSLDRRSAETVTVAVSKTDGGISGSVQLSEGPAYGQEILANVQRGWAFASVFAFLLACGVGLLISQRISAPVQALTVAAEQMYAGDLSTRVSYQAGDEFGKLASTFNAMSEQVESTIKTLQRFVMDAAHELQTPLTALRTNLELALDEPSVEKQTAFVHQAQVQADRLSRLTSGLLDLSRLEARGWAETFEAVDLAGLLREVVEPFAARAEQADQTLVLDLDAAHSMVLGSAQKLSSAVGNLLDNALKFTPAGGTITVRLYETERNCCVAVADTGIGIPPEEVGLLFNRFHRGRNAALYPGSGLGLAIVRAVAEAHGGCVEGENQPGGGACFRICLPKKEEPKNT